MIGVNINLSFDGNCEEAFIFYHSVFGGEPVFTRYRDMPKNMPVAVADRGRVAHAVLPLGAISLMGSDVPSGYRLDKGRDVSICLAPESLPKARTVAKKLSDGGRELIAPDKTFWAEYYAVFTDRFGVNWMINYEGKKRAPRKA